MPLFHRFFIFGISVLLVSGLFTHPANAQQAGITIIPTTIEEAADPGAVLSKILKVTNVSDEDKEYFLYKRNIKGVESGGVPIFTREENESTGYELSSWVSFTEEKIFVPARSMIEIPVTISVPIDASPGSHFGGVFVSLEAPRFREIGAGVGYEVATIISIRISGDIIDSARIRSFSTEKLLYGTKNVHFFAKIENQGNILIRPYGPMTITSMFSSKPEVITVNETYAGVFPGSTRDIEFDWNSDGLGFGKYEAILALSYDGDGGRKTIDSTLVFWVFPIKIMLSILGGFAAVFILGYLFTRYYIRQAIMRASGGRRIVSGRYRKQEGVSRFAFVFISMMAVLVVFLIILLIFIA